MMTVINIAVYICWPYVIIKLAEEKEKRKEKKKGKKKH